MGESIPANCISCFERLSLGVPFSRAGITFGFGVVLVWETDGQLLSLTVKEQLDKPRPTHHLHTQVVTVPTGQISELPRLKKTYKITLWPFIVHSMTKSSIICVEKCL